MCGCLGFVWFMCPSQSCVVAKQLVLIDFPACGCQKEVYSTVMFVGDRLVCLLCAVPICIPVQMCIVEAI